MDRLRLYGIKEFAQETTTKLLTSVDSIITTHLQIKMERYDIIHIHRVGKDKNHTRPILVKFQSHIKRLEILKADKLLKNYISEDLTPEDLEERKILVKFVREARKQKKRAKIIGNRLDIEGEIYTIEDLLKDKEEAEEFLLDQAQTTSTAPPAPTQSKSVRASYKNKEEGKRYHTRLGSGSRGSQHQF